jgi:competence protein ComEA
MKKKELIMTMTTMTKRLLSVACLALAAATATATPTARADEPAPAPAAEGVVNINTATPAQLGLLPGIGETKARAIMEHRQRRPFARVDDLVAVRGIGRATLRRLRPYLTVRGDTTLTRAVHVPRGTPAARPGTPAKVTTAAAPATRPRAAPRR